jgi:hypothetical protein
MATALGSAKYKNINSEMLHQLEEQLQDSAVLTADSPEYPASLKRWSNAAEKEAVRCFFLIC